MLIAFQLCTQEPSMTVRSTHGKRCILPGFLVVLLALLGQTTVTPTLAASPSCEGISDFGPGTVNWKAISLPQDPRYNEDALCDIIDNETENDPPGKSVPTLAVDLFLFEHSGATSRNNHPQLLAILSGDSYRPTAVYMLTERFRL
jgi:hypothetical protein